MDWISATATAAFVSWNDSGGVIEEGRLRTAPDALRDEFEGRAPMRIVIEVGTHSPWVSRVLEACGHEVLVANARKIRLIYANDRKSDRIDAECLARLGRLDPQLLAPIRHRGAKAQADLAHIRSRDCLVRGRAQLINHVRRAAKSMGGRLPSARGVDDEWNNGEVFQWCRSFYSNELCSCPVDGSAVSWSGDGTSTAAGPASATGKTLTWSVVHGPTRAGEAHRGRLTVEKGTQAAHT